MELIEKLKLNKTQFLSLFLVLAVVFIYGCQCEGGIGTSAKNTNTIQVNNTQKWDNRDKNLDLDGGLPIEIAKKIIKSS